jgi:23S rRNA pseudouridine1911/1915/1917 synthase
MNIFDCLPKMKNTHLPEVLYEDNHIIAVNKPSGALSQGDITGDDPLGEEVKQYIKEKYHKPGAVFLGLAHRLDRPTSGILLFARTSKALERLNNMLKERKIEKTYLAIVKNKPPKENGTLKHFLTRMENKNITRASLKNSDGAKEAVLDYRLLKASNGFYLLEVKPYTGRQHQIRVQLSAIGCPIAGDVKYGYPTANSDMSICLHAKRLQFIHPVSKIEIDVVAPTPKSGEWQRF